MNGADRLTVGEVGEAPADHSFHRTFDDSAKKFEYPLHPALTIVTGDYWEIITEIDFSFGWSFITDLDDDDIPGVLELFDSFVLYESLEKKHNEWQRGMVTSLMRYRRFTLTLRPGVAPIVDIDYFGGWSITLLVLALSRWTTR